MTNEPINSDALRASQDRRLAYLRSTPEPIMPNHPIRRPPPKARRNSVPHRAIR